MQGDKTTVCNHCSSPYSPTMITDAFERDRLAIMRKNSDKRREKGKMDSEKDVVKAMALEQQESPFLAVKPLLRAFQLLGIFNFSFDDACNFFDCRPVLCEKLLYSLFLNVLTTSCFCLVTAWFLLENGLSLSEAEQNMRSVFSNTDGVAIVGSTIVLEISFIGLQLNNMGLCSHLNTLVASVKELGVIDHHQEDKNAENKGFAANPGFRSQGIMFTVLLAMMTTAFGILGFCLPSAMLNPSQEPHLPILPSVLSALTVSLGTLYLHLPQFLSEVLLVRIVDVLEHHYEYLIGHIECCFNHRISKSILDVKGKLDIDCCVVRCKSLFILFKNIEETFCKQLVINFGLHMGCLVFAVYLSITFLISGSGSDHSITNSYMSIVFPLGFSLYSLVPITRILYNTNGVNRVMLKIDTVKRRLHNMEAMAAEDPRMKGIVRCTLRNYDSLKGFSACNFFTVNRQLVTSITGYLVTYIIVLVQFKVADVK